MKTQCPDHLRFQKAYVLQEGDGVFPSFMMIFVELDQLMAAWI